MSEELPAAVVEEAERLTRLARRASDPDEAAAYRRARADRLAEHGFTARVREDDPGETLVLHPADWVEDGTVRTDRIEDTGRAVEVSLEGPGDPDDWDAVEAHNRALVREVRAAHGEVHGDTAAAFADFMGNHCAKRIEDATAREVEEFLTEYFPRNAWPTDEQTAAATQSLRHLFRAADTDPPIGTA
jgi:hypothetical protein